MDAPLNEKHAEVDFKAKIILIAFRYFDGLIEDKRYRSLPRGSLFDEKSAREGRGGQSLVGSWIRQYRTESGGVSKRKRVRLSHVPG